jgi:hypothetical protein
MRGALRFGELGDHETSDEGFGDADPRALGAECLPIRNARAGWEFRPWEASKLPS